MQTFLPYPDFAESAQVLDPSRLGNQAYRECKTLINGSWPNHPASKMWQNHMYALAEYALALFTELKNRDRYYPEQIKFFEQKLKEFPDTGMPLWLGNENFHKSHRANLKRKAISAPDTKKQKLIEWYQARLHDWNDLDETMEYIWPTKL